LTERCPGCLIAGTCIVELTGHTTYCSWAPRGGRWLARVHELSAAGLPVPVAAVPMPDRHGAAPWTPCCGGQPYPGIPSES
jgi:hypothetical protein